MPDYSQYHASDPDLMKGMISGFAGGVAGVTVMTAFMQMSSKAMEAMKERKSDGHAAGDDERCGLSQRQEAKSQRQASKESGDGRNAEGSGGGGDEPATEKAAERISRRVFHHELDEDARKTAGNAVHFGFGAMNGVVYGGVAEYIPAATVGAGAGFGAALWLTADEIGVPAAGLSEKPTEIPVSTHVNALAAHLVFGTVTELVRSTVRSLLEEQKDHRRRLSNGHRRDESRWEEGPELIVVERRASVW